jgi:hypothetical protein
MTLSSDTFGDGNAGAKPVFPAFTRLPPELRIRIWELAVFPRTVRLKFEGSRASSPTPCPPILHACHESRAHAAYVQAFTTSSGACYVWVNFEHDMISLGDNNLPALKAHGSQIQRLSFTVADEGAYDHFYYFGKRDLEGFPRLQEIRVVVEAGMLFWPSAFADCDWGGCPRDRIHFLDVSSGLLLTGEQLNAGDD